jgi:hydroxymethylbilane synthase
MQSLSNTSRPKLVLKVAARSSLLSLVQVNEILSMIKKYHISVDFSVLSMETVGDKDQLTSLRTLEKTDFFTKEIDNSILNNLCRIGIHSAKDLPSPLPQGLKIVCLTKSIDSSDSLVLRENQKFEELPSGALIATSSLRREEVIKNLRTDLCFIDIRGTIHQRLSKLETFEADGVVIAEAALIRLGLINLNRMKLPGDTVEGQGQLAVVAREDDFEMKRLFACIDYRK